MQCKSCGGFCGEYCEKLNFSMNYKLISAKGISKVQINDLDIIISFDSKISDCICDARENGVSIETIAAILQKHATTETLRLINF